MLIQLLERLHGDKNGFRRGVENLVFDKDNDPFGQSWRQIRFKCQPALGSLPANSCDVCVLVRSWHVLVILLLYPLQDSKLAILPEMVIKRDRFPDVQPVHGRYVLARYSYFFWLTSGASSSPEPISATKGPWSAKGRPAEASGGRCCRSRIAIAHPSRPATARWYFC